jgi:large subunit ribosomal protein L32
MCCRLIVVLCHAVRSESLRWIMEIVIDIIDCDLPSWGRRKVSVRVEARKGSEMAVPKRRMSRSNTRHRRAQWKAAAPELVPIVVAGRRVLVPRRLVRAYERGLIEP